MFVSWASFLTLILLFMRVTLTSPFVSFRLSDTVHWSVSNPKASSPSLTYQQHMCFFRRPTEKSNVPLGFRQSLKRTTSHISQVAFLFSSPYLVYHLLSLYHTWKYCWGAVLFEDDELANCNVLCGLKGHVNVESSLVFVFGFVSLPVVTVQLVDFVRSALVFT